MFAVRTSIGQSRCRRKRNKTLGMCIKGDAGTTSGIAGLTGLTTNSLTNSTDESIFSSDFNSNTDYTFGPHNDTDNDDLTDLEEFEYNIPSEYEMANSSVLLGQDTQQARYLKNGTY